MGWKALVKRDLTPGTQKVQETGIFTDDYKIYKILVTEFDMSDTGYFRCRFLENGVEQTSGNHSIIGRTGSSYASAGYLASRQQGGMHFMGYRNEEDIFI
jgi:hypothetical protein